MIKSCWISYCKNKGITHHLCDRHYHIIRYATDKDHRLKSKERGKNRVLREKFRRDYINSLSHEELLEEIGE